MSSLPLHLLPPHVKLQILAKLSAQPQQTTAAASSLSSSSPASSASSSASDSLSLPSELFTSPPFFPLSSLTSAALPPPFTSSAMTQLHTDGYCIVDGFLSSSSDSPSALSADVALLKSTGGFRQGGMQSQQSWKEAQVRGDSVCWLSSTAPDPSTPAIAALLSQLNAAMAALAAVWPASFPCIPSSSQLAVYAPGARYVRHRDAHGEGGPQRRLTAIVYLNADWEAGMGGQLRLYVQRRRKQAEEDEKKGEAAAVEETAVDVLPVYGRLLLFLSLEIEHEVLAATQRRLAITTWYK